MAESSFSADIDIEGGGDYAVEVMRKELRSTFLEERKSHRQAALNEKRSAALGEIKSKKCSLKTKDVAAMAKQLKKRTLSMEDYLLLQTSLIQDAANIDSFLRVDNILTALTRDISSQNPAIQMVAANCCCNIALADARACNSLAKIAGPYLVAELDCLNRHLVEVCAWTIGNLCTGSNSAFQSLYAQGCLKRLSSLLSECDESSLSSISYAIKHILYAGYDIITDAEMADLARSLVVQARYLDNKEILWVFALLSSREDCSTILCSALPAICRNVRETLTSQKSDFEQVTPAIRILGNLACEASGSAAENILDCSKDEIIALFDTLLRHPQLHVRKETLWLLGNLYTHEQLKIREKTKELICLLPSLKFATRL